MCRSWINLRKLPFLREGGKKSRFLSFYPRTPGLELFLQLPHSLSATRRKPEREKKGKISPARPSLPCVEAGERPPAAAGLVHGLKAELRAEPSSAGGGLPPTKAIGRWCAAAKVRKVWVLGSVLTWRGLPGPTGTPRMSRGFRAPKRCFPRGLTPPAPRPLRQEVAVGEGVLHRAGGQGGGRTSLLATPVTIINTFAKRKGFCLGRS